MSRILDRFRKLHRMPLGEIAGRLVAQFQARRERAAFQRNQTPVDRLGGGLTERARQQLRAILLPGASAAELARLQRIHVADHNRLVADAAARAAQILDGPIELLGAKVDLTGAVDWHQDPKTGFLFPRKYHADVAIYELEGGVDVKHVWELNRHHFLVDLALGWRCTGNEALAARARALLVSWLDDNQPLTGVNWTSALEVAARSISWIWTLAALADWAGWQPEELDRIAAALADHARYLVGHFSYYSSPYNHLIGEATALYLLGRAFTGSPAASQWESLAAGVLCKHGPRQFYRDGFCVEQATGYHYFTLGFLTLAYLAAPTGSAVRRTLEAGLRAGYSAGAAFRQPDSRWPAIGDVDSARSIPVWHDDFWDFRSLNALGAGIFGLADLKRDADGPGPELFWLSGCAGVNVWHQLPESSPLRCQLLPDAGYAVASNAAGDWLLFDGGPLADGVFADATASVAHGHADALQVLLMLAGQRILVDRGIAAYAGPRPWVEGFRTPQSHNVMEIVGAPVARVAGRLGWSHVRNPRELVARFDENLWHMQARLDMDHGVAVERQVRMQPGIGAWIEDRIFTPGPRHVTWYWQLPVLASPIQRISESTTTLQFADFYIDIQTADAAVTVVAEPAEHSPGYGRSAAGTRLRVRAEVQHELTLVTFFSAKPAASPS